MSPATRKTLSTAAPLSDGASPVEQNQEETEDLKVMKKFEELSNMLSSERAGVHLFFDPVKRKYHTPNFALRQIFFLLSPKKCLHLTR